jgi:transcription initiation factor TFIID/TFIIF subunit
MKTARFADKYIISDKPSPVEQFPMREWSMKVFMVDEDGNERSADVFTKVVYNLHPTFENPVQSMFDIRFNVEDF